jgi:guanylate cyclase
MEHIRNRRYRSVLGFDVSQIFLFLYATISISYTLFVSFLLPQGVFIDSNGDAEGNYTVLSLLPFQENNFKSDEGTQNNYFMQPVGHFQHNISSTRSPNDSRRRSSKDLNAKL